MKQKRSPTLSQVVRGQPCSVCFRFKKKHNKVSYYTKQMYLLCPIANDPHGDKAEYWPMDNLEIFEAYEDIKEVLTDDGKDVTVSGKDNK